METGLIKRQEEFAQLLTISGSVTIGSVAGIFLIVAAVHKIVVGPTPVMGISRGPPTVLVILITGRCGGRGRRGGARVLVMRRTIITMDTIAISVRIILAAAAALIPRLVIVRGREAPATTTRIIPVVPVVVVVAVSIRRISRRCGL